MRARARLLRARQGAVELKRRARAAGRRAPPIQPRLSLSTTNKRLTLAGLHRGQDGLDRRIDRQVEREGAVCGCVGGCGGGSA